MGLPLRCAAVRLLLAVAFVGPVIVGCGAGVNEDLVATSTAYPVRSPVAASSAATAADPDAGTGLTAAGEEAMARGDWESAERSFDRALLRDPGDVAALVGRAEANLALGDLAGARADLDEVVALELTEPGQIQQRAALRFRFGDAIGAEADYTRVLAAEPGSAVSLAGRGEALLAQALGDQNLYDRAMADFTRAVALDPGLINARLGPALVFADRAIFGGDPADWQRAADELDALGDAVPMDAPRRAATEARVQLALGDVEQAHARLAASASGRLVGPEKALVGAVAAEIALMAGDWAEAARLAVSTIEDDPLSWVGRRVLVRAEVGRGAFDAALAAADELIGLLPGDGQALYLRGLALAGLGREAEARQVLAEAGSALAASPVYQARIAEAIDALGRQLPGGLTGSSVDLPRLATATPSIEAGRFGG